MVLLRGKKDCTTSPFFGKPNMISLMGKNSCDENKAVWDYAYQTNHGFWDPKTLKFPATGYMSTQYSIEDIKTNVVIGSKRYMKVLIEGGPTLFNKHGIRTKDE
ncbi:hypothetical protein TNIN_7341 [Trichonephila inaurata madagascariensis]|uniref:Uncharacterized protein n=1 Tax=Trichonephila inaurata madagascariensis TaxID=2747483 RepID=A0A8X7BQ29_9ARAC|nr:hypothetical protein TNIN_7341 [Trichonephila inaurata madagascariensis]